MVHLIDISIIFNDSTIFIQRTIKLYERWADLRLFFGLTSILSTSSTIIGVYNMSSINSIHYHLFLQYIYLT